MVLCVSFNHELALYVSESKFIVLIDIGMQLSDFHIN